jgi:hypothetical protein
MSPDRCLMLCLLCAFSPTGIIYWILTARRQPQLGELERSMIKVGFRIVPGK